MSGTTETSKERVICPGAMPPDLPARPYRILRNDREPLAQIGESDRGHIDAVHEAATLHIAILDEAKQRGDQRRLARAGAPDDAHFLAAANGQRDAVEHERQTVAIPQLQVVELDGAVFGPRGARLLLDGAATCALGGQVLHVVLHALHAGGGAGAGDERGE
jgi:hypothetical protein